MFYLAQSYPKIDSLTLLYLVTIETSKVGQRPVNSDGQI